MTKQIAPKPQSLQNNHRRDKNISFIDSVLLKLVSPQDALNRLFTKGSEKRHSGSQSVFNKISCALVTARRGFFWVRLESKNIRYFLIIISDTREELFNFELRRGWFLQWKKKRRK